MTHPQYYIKKVRRNDNGQIVQVKTSNDLDARRRKPRKGKKVMKNLKNGKDIRTAYLDDGCWTAGDQVTLHDGKWLRTEGNTTERDNLGRLKSF